MMTNAPCGSTGVRRVGAFGGELWLIVGGTPGSTGKQFVVAGGTGPPVTQRGRISFRGDREVQSTASASARDVCIATHAATTQTVAKCSPAAASVKACQTSWYENVLGRSVGH